MKFDQDKIDDAALALLSMTLDENHSAWKQLDWGITDSLYKKGYIHNPVNKNKSIAFTEAGVNKAAAVFKQLFAQD